MPIQFITVLCDGVPQLDYGRLKSLIDEMDRDDPCDLQPVARESLLKDYNGDSAPDNLQGGFLALFQDFDVVGEIIAERLSLPFDEPDEANNFDEMELVEHSAVIRLALGGAPRMAKRIRGCSSCCASRWRSAKWAAWDT